MDQRELEAVIEHSPVPTYVFDASRPDFVLVAVNAVVRKEHPELVGLIGHPMAGLYADQPQFLLDAQRAVAERGVVVRDTPVRRYDRLEANEVLRLTYAFVPPSYLLVHSDDLSPPAVTEAALRESEERYRSLVASMPDGVVLRGRDGLILASNHAAARLFGYTSASELLGKQALLPQGYTLEDEEGNPVARHQLPSRQVLETGEAVLGRFYAQIDPTGARRWVRVSTQPIRDASGATAGLVTTYTDETERVTAQHALRESSARLDLALDAARMGTWEWEPETGQGSWSENLYRIFDVPNAGEGLAAFMAMVHEDDRMRIAERLAAVVQTADDGARVEAECRIVGEDKRTRWARFGGRMFRGNGRMRIVGTVLDITERRLLEEELLRAHRLESLGRLAGGVAHDFNNLLAAMLGSLEFIEERAPAMLAEDVATAKHAAERARDLTRQLLAFARRQPIQPVVLDLSALVGGVERLLRRLVGGDVVLEVDRGEALHVLADAAQLEQVLVNLVVNARDATPRGGSVGVRLDATHLADASGEIRAGHYAALEVWDTGAGMDEETRRHAFDPFFTTKELGTGLGLASCYGIVRQHDGHILVDSAPGRGTKFRVLLPRVESGEAAAGGTAHDASKAQSTGRILVVDDEPLVRATTARILQSIGYQVLVAGSGDEAIERVTRDTGRIDAIVCDVVMPGMNGPELAKELLLLRPGLKVLFVSGYPADAIHEGLSGVAFLQKPYTRAALAQKLRELIET
jgi:two-component system, cell cycle sensor histidine kinase and response regulator CckA